MPKQTYISHLVQDTQGCVGEVWSVEPSPFYGDSRELAYVVFTWEGNSSADWLPLDELTLLDGTAVEVAAVAA